MAIAKSIGCNRPIRFQTGGNGNVFQQATHLFLAWQSRPAPSYMPGSDNESGDGSEKEGCMTRKLLKTAALVVIALAPVVAAGTAEAHGSGFGASGFGGDGFHAGVFTAAVSGGEVFATAAFVATGFGLVGFLEGFTPATMEAITPATTDTALAI
jgi:hypothetical protein